jgi:hypothetical protein
MVSFTELIELVKKNPTYSESLPVWKIVEPIRSWSLPPVVEVAPATTLAVAPAPPAPPVPVVTTKPVAKPVAPAKPVAKPVEPILNIHPIGRPLDIISIGIEDVVYASAPLLTGRQIEKEEAIRLEALIPTLYSSEGGRSRGWTKKLLETHLRSRSAIGGDIYALQHAKLGGKTFVHKETIENLFKKEK